MSPEEKERLREQALRFIREGERRSMMNSVFG